MKIFKNVRRHLPIVAVMTVLFCMSSIVALATGKNIESDDGTIIETPTESEKKPVQFQENGDLILTMEDAQENEEVRLFTFSIYNEADKKVGTIELRYGYRTSYYGKRLWITTGTSPVEIDQKYYSAGRTALNITQKTWTNFFANANENYSYTVESKVLPNIPSPQNVEWDASTVPGRINFDAVEEAEGRYLLTLYNGEKTVVSTSVNYSVKKPVETMNFAPDINESGEYIVEVRAIGGKTEGDSVGTVSVPYSYNMPGEKVGITTNVWWTTKEGELMPTVVNWNPVAGAGGYQVELGIYRQDGSYVRSVVKTLYNKNNELVTSTDMEKIITENNTEENEELNYIVSVRSLAGNIEVVANASDEDCFSLDEYKTSDIIAEVKETLDTATADTIVDVISEIGLNSVATAMQTDEAILSKIAELEAEVAKENNVTVKPPVVEHPGIRPSSIKVVGAGINAVTGGAASASTIGLNFSKPEKDVPVNEELYENAVQVNISLDKDNVEMTGELICPITITMLPPTGVNLDKLVILHYHADGTYESIYPAKNSDGTITFSVTSFSDFVFANIIQFNGGNNSDNDADNDNKDDENTDDKDDNTNTDDKDDNDNDNTDDKDDNDNSGNNNGNDNNNSSNNNSYYEDDDSSSSEASSTSTTVSMGVRVYGNSKRFVKADGTYAKAEWVKKGNTWYYAGADSTLLTGWYQNPDGVWYFLKDNCEMATGWQMVDGKWYYLDTVNGDMRTGWLQDADGKWYFMGADGDMQTGWLQTADGKWYYLGADGVCYMNMVTPDGYVVDEKGAWAI